MTRHFFALLLVGLLAVTTHAAEIDADLQKLIDQIAAGAASDGGAILAPHISTDMFRSRTLRGIDEKSDMAKAFDTQLNTIAPMLDQQLRRSLGDMGTYRFVTIRHDGPDTLVTFRLTTAEGLNYHQLLIRKRKGIYQIADVNVMAAGEYMSETMRRFLLTALDTSNQGLMERLNGDENLLVKNIDTVNRLLVHFQSGEMKQVHTVYGQLPKELQEMRSIMTVQIMALGQLALEDPALYAEMGKLAARYNTLYPGTSNIDMLMLDVHIANQDWQKGLASVDRIDKAMGPDPYLDHLRGNIYMFKGDLATAKPLFAAVIKHDPSLADPYFSLLDVARAEGDFATMTKVLKELYVNCSLVLSQISTVAGYEAYGKSPEHAAYLAYLKEVGEL